jgi:hypothetical protein
MMRRLRLVVAAAAFSAGAAHAQFLQTQIGVSPVLQVQSLAPQLVAFAGSDVNFQNLVNGLALGLPVTLTTAVAPGVTQVVSFTPLGTMSAVQIAQTLETARQVAIANGIAAPTAQQLGVLLTGGALPTAAGSTNVSTLVGTANALNASLATASPAAQLQSTRRFSVSDSPLPRGVADTPLTAPTSNASTPVPGGTTGSATSAAAPAGRILPGNAATGGTTGGAARTPRFGATR